RHRDRGSRVARPHSLSESRQADRNSQKWEWAQQTINFITLNSLLSLFRSRENHIVIGLADAKH
ncbi:MAG TPA: hypothetical protein VHM01_15915, partial [Alphaproteobacteria bacterium]|nr:hypothetical protein [Alphaproteobacteria bacterium]